MAVRRAKCRKAIVVYVCVKQKQKILQEGADKRFSEFSAEGKMCKSIRIFFLKDMIVG
jgi:hypothetical protein